MKMVTALMAAVLPLPLLLVAAAPDQDRKPQPNKKPRVEAVFVLDTTGSMGGLIDGAKKKIWSIVNEIASGKPTPDVRVGFVAYRDRGDAYVTQVQDLSDDLDKAFAALQKFQAAGGGDGPEHVSKALHDAVKEIQWSSDKEAFKVIFLVGDAPPHVDYNDGFDYKKACEAAIRKDIIVNTVRCGNDGNTELYWKEIATLGEGKYISIAQTGNMAVRETPFDKDIAKLGQKMDGTRVARAGKERELEAKCDPVMASGAGKSPAACPPPSAPALAERAMFNAKSGQIHRGVDLVTDIIEGRVKLEDVKESDLPEDLRKMSKEERKNYIDGKIKEREEVARQMRELEEKRSAYLKEEAKKNKSGDSFDEAVLKTIEEQAKKKGIEYGK